MGVGVVNVTSGNIVVYCYAITMLILIMNILLILQLLTPILATSYNNTNN